MSDAADRGSEVCIGRCLSGRYARWLYRFSVCWMFARTMVCQKPNMRRAFAVVFSATFSVDMPLASATFSQMQVRYELSLRLPLNGTGGR